MAWIQRHVPNCPECMRANIVKALEYEAAAMMSPQHALLFQRGGDVTKLEGFRPVLKKVMEHAVERGIVSPDIFDWMLGTAKKYGTDWPGLQHVQQFASSD